jgi:hypothetical protein
MTIEERIDQLRDDLKAKSKTDVEGWLRPRFQPATEEPLPELPPEPPRPDVKADV